MSSHEHTPEVHEHADAWHHHENAEGEPQHEHTATVNTGLLAKWFVALVVGFGVVVVLLVMFFGREVTARKAAAIETNVLAREYLNYRRNSEKALGMGDGGAAFTYEWSDPKAGAVQIPVEDAMKKVEAKYQGSR